MIRAPRSSPLEYDPSLIILQIPLDLNEERPSQLGKGVAHKATRMLSGLL